MALWVAISGGKNVGKTSVIEQIIKCLTPLGYRVATVKHTHLTFDLDPPGSDTSRHRKAGAETVVLAAPHGFHLYHEASKGKDLPPSISNLLSKSDIVLCEGFYRSDMPKVVIESSTKDEKTASEPGDPVILRVRLKNDQKNAPTLASDDLDTILSYIKKRQRPSGHAAPPPSEEY